MEILFDELSPGQAYNTMVQALVPRPIAWVLSEHEAGNYNLAPFSYFTAISSAPPLLMLSLGRKADGTDKDTLVNIRERQNFVVHIAHRQMLEALNASAATLPAGKSELELSALAVTDFAASRLPRLADCRLAFACHCYQIQEIGEAPQTLIFGQIDALYIDDGLVTTNSAGRQSIDVRALDPIARLGANEYALLGDIIALPRPD